MTLSQAFLSVALMASMNHLSIRTATAQSPPAPIAPVAREPALQGNTEPQLIKPPVQVKNVRSVLGIEVRGSQEKNIGRIVDLLADVNGGVGAAVIEFGGFLGIGTRKIAIDWSSLRFEMEDKQLIAILEIPRDQLRAAPDYKPGRPTVLTK